MFTTYGRGPLACNIEVVVGKDGDVFVVDRHATTVENAAQHVFGHRDPQHVSAELDVGGPIINATGSLEHLRHFQQRQSRVSANFGHRMNRIRAL